MCRFWRCILSESKRHCINNFRGDIAPRTPFFLTLQQLKISDFLIRKWTKSFLMHLWMFLHKENAHNPQNTSFIFALPYPLPKACPRISCCGVPPLAEHCARSYENFISFPTVLLVAEPPFATDAQVDTRVQLRLATSTRYFEKHLLATLEKKGRNILSLRLCWYQTM